MEIRDTLPEALRKAKTWLDNYDDEWAIFMALGVVLYSIGSWSEGQHAPAIMKTLRDAAEHACDDVANSGADRVTHYFLSEAINQAIGALEQEQAA